MSRFLHLLGTQAESKNLSWEYGPDSHFLIASPQHLGDLALAASRAIAEKIPLVLLPPAAAAEKATLLAQLPAEFPADTQLVVFSSGTSGEPKAILHSAASLRWNAERVALKFSEKKIESYFLALSPFSMAGSFFGFWLPYFTEKFTVFASSDRWIFFAPHFFQSLLEKNWQATILNPFALQTLEKIGDISEFPEDQPHLFISLTAPLPSIQRRRWEAGAQFTLAEIYGMTEAAGPIIYEGESLGAELSLAADAELLLHSPGLATYYAHAGKLAPLPRPFPTGDLARSHQAAGITAWEIMGRKREMVSVGGKKVAPGLVEAVVLAAPGVAAACAGAIPDADYGERVGLVLETKAGFSPTAFATYLRNQLSFEQQPKKWLSIASIPRNAGGKALRAAAMKLLDVDK